jgi:hypothetical protein
MLNFNKIINYIFLVLGLLLYIFAVLTSSWHIYHIYSLFENDFEKYVALFITIALEVSIIFITYVYYWVKNLYRFKNISRFLYFVIIFLIIYLWFLNYIYMEKNFTEKIIVFQKYDISFIIPFIASFFLPFTSISLSISIIILINRLMMFYYTEKKRKKEKEESIENEKENNKKK